MQFLSFLALACLVAFASAVGTTTKVPNTRKQHSKALFDNVDLEKTEAGCHSKNGRWVTITLTDEGGNNGIQMDVISVDKQNVVKSVKTPVGTSRARDRRLSRRGDIVTFKDEFCLDYYGKHYAPCYDLVTSSQGKNLDELSWSVRISAMIKASEEEKKQGKKDEIRTARKEGAVYDDVKVLCGRLFKQLGRFTDRQLDKVDEKLADSDGKGDYHQKQETNYLRAYQNVYDKAEELNLIAKKIE